MQSEMFQGAFDDFRVNKIRQEMRNLFYISRNWKPSAKELIKMANRFKVTDGDALRAYIAVKKMMDDRGEYLEDEEDLEKDIENQ